VKEQASKTPAVILETPKSTKEKISEVKGKTQEKSTSKPVRKRLIRSQIAKEKGKTVISGEDSSLKGDLNDILKAIDVTESPLVQVDVTKFDQRKSKKVKLSKKLEFEHDVTTFVFKPRKPLTKQSKKMQESNVELERIEEAFAIQEELIDLPSLRPKGDKNVVPTTQTEKSSYEVMEERLKAANNEIARLRVRGGEHAAKRTNFKRMKALWEAEKVSKPEIVSSETQYFTWIVPAIKEARFVRKINAQLRDTSRGLKRKIEDMEIQLTKSGKGSTTITKQGVENRQ